MDRGRCRELPNEILQQLFFPESKSNAAGRKAVQTICGACPVALKCFVHAIETKEGDAYTRNHVWGGLDLLGRNKLHAEMVKKKEWDEFVWQANES